MAVMINTAELKETLSLTPTNQNIMLVGKHGIGKSVLIVHLVVGIGIQNDTLAFSVAKGFGDVHDVFLSDIILLKKDIISSRIFSISILSTLLTQYPKHSPI